MNIDFTISVTVLNSILLCLSLTTSGNQVSGQSNIFSMIGTESNILVSSGLGDDIITCTGLICSGTIQDEVIIGSFLNEEISGLGGDDIVQGNNGDDVIYGGPGSDSIQGGGGLDNIFGGDGNDYIYSDSSTSLSGSLVEDQVAIVNRLNEKLLGTEIENTVLPAGHIPGVINVADTFASLNSNMLIYSESHLEGGEGNDYLFGGSDNDVFSGGPGNDFFECNEGFDRVLDFDPDEDTANVDCEIL